MENELLDKAIVRLKQKKLPSVSGQTNFVPQNEHTHIFDMLEVWDKDCTDEDVNLKTKFIYDTLKEIGNPKDQLISLFTILGANPPFETKVNRIYKYLKLKVQANKHISQYENIQREINALSRG